MIEFYQIVLDLAVFFSFFPNLLSLWRGEPISCGKPIKQNAQLTRSPFLYFNFKIFKGPNSMLLTRFQCTLFDSAVFKFLQIKEWAAILLWGWGAISLKDWFFAPLTSTSRSLLLFRSHFCISILEVLRTCLLSHWSDLNAL